MFKNFNRLAAKTKRTYSCHPLTLCRVSRPICPSTFEVTAISSFQLSTKSNFNKEAVRGGIYSIISLIRFSQSTNRVIYLLDRLYTLDMVIVALTGIHALA